MWNRANDFNAITHRPKGDMSAARLRLAELRAADKLGRPCRPMREWVPTQASWYGARAITALCGCKYPIGDPRAQGFHFCNRKRRIGPYCYEHDTITHGVIPWKLDLKEALK